MKKKILFACDLDNTLIHSFRYKRDFDVCIEWIDGKEQGYMSPRAIELLRAVQDRVELLPITTRSVEQYKRIVWPTGCVPSRAITTNGAILLQNGEPDAEWQQTFQRLVHPVYNDLEALRDRLLLQEETYSRVRMVNDMYLFAYCREGVDADACAAEHALPGMQVLVARRKLYFFPLGMDKGSALARIRACRSQDSAVDPVYAEVVAAGDSSIDLPMLRQADLALVPTGDMAEQLEGAHVMVCPDEQPFADFALQQVKNRADILSV